MGIPHECHPCLDSIRVPHHESQTSRCQSTPVAESFSSGLGPANKLPPKKIFKKKNQGTLKSNCYRVISEINRCWPQIGLTTLVCFLLYRPAPFAPEEYGALPILVPAFFHRDGQVNLDERAVVVSDQIGLIFRFYPLAYGAERLRKGSDYLWEMLGWILDMLSQWIVGEGLEGKGNWWLRR